MSGAHRAPDSNAIVVGLIGSGIQLSRSPALHEREGARQGLTYIYRLVDLEVLGLGVDALPELFTAARRFAFTTQRHPSLQAGDHPASR